MRKFFTITFIALIILFAYGMFSKGKQNLYFYFSSPYPEQANSTTDYLFQSCQPKAAILKSTLSYNNNLQAALNWMLSYKTPKVSGLDNPFYASTLQANVTQSDSYTIVDIQGQAILESECFEADFKVLIEKTIEYYLQDIPYQIQLNGSSQDFIDFGTLK